MSKLIAFAIFHPLRALNSIMKRELYADTFNVRLFFVYFCHKHMDVAKMMEELICRFVTIFVLVPLAKNYQNKLDVIINNVSNASTIGLKRSKVTFMKSFQSMKSTAVPNSGNTSFGNPATGYGLVNSQIDSEV